MNKDDSLRLWWLHEIGKDNLRKRMHDWSKKLHHLDDEMLYFVHYEASRIIEQRMEKQDEA